VTSRSVDPAAAPPEPARRVLSSTQDSERSAAIGSGLTWLSTWCLRVGLLAVGATLLFLLLRQLYVVVLPVVLALLLASVLWAPTAFLRRRGVPPAVAALLVVLGSLAAIVGLFAGLAPQVVDQVGEIAGSAAGGLEKIQVYVTGPPLDLDAAQVDAAVGQATDKLRGSATAGTSGRP
jgi:predicted PurR-regulated permease PerM